MRFTNCAVVAFTLLGIVSADLFMQNPRGSNNRLNEKSAKRKNGNRVFDSQNNDRGGYNVGDKTKEAFVDEEGQYRMTYFQSGKSGETILPVEWTNQHGCGEHDRNNPLKVNCNFVLQFMCQPNTGEIAPRDGYTLRNGRLLSSQLYDQGKARRARNKQQKENRRLIEALENRVIHESWEWYDACATRDRNENLFTADQNLKRSSARSTRQNPNGNRRGYECPEERDYYPYFHPTPWVDVAVLAYNEAHCEQYKARSFNTRPLHECVQQFVDGSGRNHASSANTAAKCAEQGGVWTEYYQMLELAPDFMTQETCEANNAANSAIKYKWGKPYDVKKIVNHLEIVDTCFVLPPELDCKGGDWSRVNHHGNGRELRQLYYDWKLPHFPSNQDQRCVFRMRYNISTDDYAPFQTDASDNEVISGDPSVDVGIGDKKLKLAINTAQFGRTFQDRSHVFILRSRSGTEIPDESRIINLNVRGKRGNIVQTYPATEYDFVPNRMTIAPTHLVHIQWTGSNTHNNNNPAGDGQAGDAGEGDSGTDRHNFVELRHPSENFPRPYEQNTIFNNMEVVWNSLGREVGNGAARQKNHAIQLASSGYYRCERASDCGEESVETKEEMDSQLNNVSPSYAGMVFKLAEGTYHYMCTRNNNFSNRSQKGHIIVEE